MLLLFTRAYADQVSVFNLIRYLTFRAGGACLTSLIIAFVLGPMIIRWLKSVQRGGQPIRLDGPERHLVEKKGTPTMGGMLMLLAMGFSVLVWGNLGNGYVWAVLFVTFGYGAIGFADDFLKLSRRNTKGVSARGKLVAQLIIGLIAAAWMSWLTRGPLATGLTIPVFKEVLIPFSYAFPAGGHAGDAGFL